MSVSSVSSAYSFLSAFSARNANSANKASASSAADTPITASASSASDGSNAASASPTGGAYDFTSMTSGGLSQTANDLFNAGKITEREVHSVLRLTLPLPRLEGGVLVARPESPTQLHNYLEEARQRLAGDKANSSYAAPGQIEAMQSLIDKMTALQGAPKGVDKVA